MRKQRSPGSISASLGLLLACACGPSVTVPSGSGSGDASSDNASSDNTSSDNTGSAGADSSDADDAPSDPLPPPPETGTSTGPTLEPWDDVPPWQVPDDCAWLLEEQAYCLLISDAETTLYGIDSGLECPFPSPALETPSGASWLGMSLAWCGRNEDTRESQVEMVRLDTGESAAFPVPCFTTASDRDRLFVVSFAEFDTLPMREYTTYAELAADDPVSTYPVVSSYQELAISRREAWLAPVRAETVESFDLDANEPLPEVNTPENEVEHGPFARGAFEVINDLIILGSTNEAGQAGDPESLNFFDRGTGELVERRTLPGGRHAKSLLCRSTL